MKKHIKKIIIALLVIIAPLISLAYVTSVDTNPAQNITHVHATLFGTVHSTDANFIAKFRYSLDEPPRCNLIQNYTEVAAIIGVGNNGAYSIQQDVVGLTPSTTYYFCALGYIPNGPIRYGDIFSFTTNALPPPPPPPTVDPNGGSGILSSAIETIGCVTTYGAYNIEDTSATVRGRSCSAAKYSYFRYSAMARPPVFCNEIYGTNMRYTGDLKPTPGEVITNLTDLQPDTTYYYCLIASNDTTISYGVGKPGYTGVQNFHTKPCKTCVQTTVVTKPATVLSKSSADLKGEYGSTKIVTTYFEYKKAPAQEGSGNGNIGTSWTQTTPQEHDANTYQKIHFVIKGLTSNTLYEFRAVATTEDPAETFYAKDILLFKTPKSNDLIDDITGKCPDGWTGTYPDCIPPEEPACDDGIQNGDETGVDEGGSCEEEATCDDGIQNGTETGVDTGGSCMEAPPTCEEQGMIGVPPDCVLPPPTCEEQGMTGTYPDCIAPPPTCEEQGMTGTYPDCIAPPPTCEEQGMTGTYPNCSDPVSTCEEMGMTGTYPNCSDPVTTCAELGMTGTYPNCVGTPPTCAELGMTGTYPNCIAPPPTCQELGMTGTYPNCSNPVSTCAEMGMTGTYPNCTNPVTTCAEMGMTGTYPNCVNPVTTCEEMNLIGTYPACVNPNGNGDNENNGSDIDNDDIPNVIDNDTDGDGISNTTDPDDDNDGVSDGSDTTPTGIGGPNDYDGDGIPNWSDWNIDGDGIPNIIDKDTDGDGISNTTDPDDDNDGVSDSSDSTPTGVGNRNDYDGDGISNISDQTPLGGKSSVNNNNGNPVGNNGNPSVLGDTVTPPNDAIVRYHEGVETVFIRQIMKNTVLQNKYGFKQGGDLQAFANYLAHFFGKHYGYVAKNGKEVRVRYADVAAYELREVGNKTIVYESYLNNKTKNFEITGIRSLSGIFKTIFKYEYYFLKKK